jgi:hypothetical protein
MTEFKYSVILNTEICACLTLLEQPNGPHSSMPKIGYTRTLSTKRVIFAPIRDSR